MVSERPLYRLIDARIISAMNMDLPRKVRYSARKKSSPVKVNKACRIGRDYDSFTSYLEENPFLPVTQLDSVEGISTTGLAGGLLTPYKGSFPALESKDSSNSSPAATSFPTKPLGLYFICSFLPAHP